MVTPKCLLISCNTMLPIAMGLSFVTPIYCACYFTKKNASTTKKYSNFHLLPPQFTHIYLPVATIFTKMVICYHYTSLPVAIFPREKLRIPHH